MKIKIFFKHASSKCVRAKSGIAITAGVIGMAGLGLGLVGNASALSVTDGLEINPVYQDYLNDVAAGKGAN